MNHLANTVEKPEHETIVYKKTTVQAVNHDVIRSRRVVAMLKHDPMAEVFRMLRTKVLKQLRKNNWHSFAITAQHKAPANQWLLQTWPSQCLWKLIRRCCWLIWI